MKPTGCIILFFLFARFSYSQSSGCIPNTTNGSFEQPVVTTCWNSFGVSAVPDWGTTATDTMIEIWDGACMGVPAYQGNQFAELNANMVSHLYVDLCATCPNVVAWQFAHRGRSGVDVCELKVGPPGGPYVSLGTFSDGNAAWGFYTGTYSVPAGQPITRFLFESVSSAGGDPTVGNFLDAVSFSFPPMNSTTTQTNVICNGANNGTASVSVSSGTLPYTYLWSNSASTSAISNLGPGTYSVSVIDASCVISGVELVTNGNFSAGNTGFTSTYTYTPPPNTGEGQYWVAPGSSVSGWNGGMFSNGDHTTGTGNFMIVNGSGTPGSNVWCQTIAVTPNTNYDLSTWVSSLNNTSPAMLQFSVNGTPLGPVFNAPAIWGPWQQFFSVWNSGASTSVTICVENMNTILGGNDFGLDDISFQACYPCTTTATVTITEPPPLTLAGISSDEFCNRADGSASVASSGGTGSHTYLWSASSQTTSSITGLIAGNYSITVTDANGCTHDTVLVVNFIPGPTAMAGADVSICEGFSTSLSASGGGNYLWTPASGLSSSTVSNPTAFPTITTSYTITVTDGNNCSSSDDVTVTVFPRPLANFSVTTVCFNNPTLFTDLSTGSISEWDWSFGDGNIDSIQNPSHTYNSAGTFVTLLIVTSSDGCKDTFGLVVTVNPLPAVNFSYIPVCIGSPTCFQDLTTIATGTITAWSWNFGDPASGPGNISNMQHPCHVFTDTGAFNVVLTVTSNLGCQSTTILVAVVLPPPIAAFISSNTCLNTPTSFVDASSSATSWYWQFGDGGTSVTQNPSHTYLGYGTYIVSLIVSSTGSCADTVQDTLTVSPLPIVNFFADTVCLGDTTTFSDLSFIPAGNISQWHWDFGDGDTSNLQNPVHFFTSPGNHTVTLTCTSNNICASSLVLSVMVYYPPVAGFDYLPSPYVQLIDLVEFTDLSTGGVVSWFWDFGDGDTTSLQHPIHYYQDTGAYVITLIVVTPNGCRDTIQQLLEVRDFAFYVPNTFTPNGDDKNDLFFALGIGIKYYEMSIFDRWGNLIFFCTVNGLPQTFPCLWDGKVKGGDNEVVQEDVYVYKIKFISVFKKEYTYIGNVNVVK